jgi:hypothetical protein
MDVTWHRRTRILLRGDAGCFVLGDLSEEREGDIDPGRVAACSRGGPRSGAPPVCLIKHMTTRNGSKINPRPSQRSTKNVVNDSDCVRCVQTTGKLI